MPGRRKKPRCASGHFRVYGLPSTTPAGWPEAPTCWLAGKHQKRERTAHHRLSHLAAGSCDVRAQQRGAELPREASLGTQPRHDPMKISAQSMSNATTAAIRPTTPAHERRPRKTKTAAAIAIGGPKTNVKLANPASASLLARRRRRHRYQEQRDPNAGEDQVGDGGSQRCGGGRHGVRESTRCQVMQRRQRGGGIPSPRASRPSAARARLADPPTQVVNG